MPVCSTDSSFNSISVVTQYVCITDTVLFIDVLVHSETLTHAIGNLFFLNAFQYLFGVYKSLGA